MPQTNISDSAKALMEEINNRKTYLETEVYPLLAQSEEGGTDEKKNVFDAADSQYSEMQEASGYIKQAYLSALSASDELSSRMKELRKSEKRRILNAPSNALIDYKEEETGHFAQKLNAYKIALIVFIGSFAGVIVELIWCYIRNGHFESRSGLVYGPFNLLYGAGALFLTLTLYRFRNRSSLWSFAGGMIVGSALEYLCSFGQELVFGSASWDYSQMPFNVNGRICLMYSVFWGVLGVMWIKNIYPWIAWIILKIPNHIGKAFTVAAVVFLVINSAVSYTAVDRWSKRHSGMTAKNAAQRFIDERFPDSRMEKIYANMTFDK